MPDSNRSPDGTGDKHTGTKLLGEFVPCVIVGAVVGALIGLIFSGPRTGFIIGGWCGTCFGIPGLLQAKYDTSPASVSARASDLENTLVFLLFVPGSGIVGGWLFGADGAIGGLVLGVLAFANGYLRNDR